MRGFSCLFLTVAVMATSLAQAARGEQPGGEQGRLPAETTQLGDVEQNLGPFVIAGRSFTVLLHAKRLKGVPESHLALTLVALNIRDPNGVDLYQKTFPVEIGQGKFKLAVNASARLLAGGSNRGVSYSGLLVRYRFYSSLGGGKSDEAWQVFGYRDGKLALFDKPATTGSPVGSPLAVAAATSPRGGNSVPIAPSGDTSDLRVWTGNFYVIVPVLVDWERGKLAPARRCLGMRGSPQLQEIGCPLQVQAERTPPDSETTFLGLLTGQGPNEGEAKHVVLDKKSTIQFLQANTIIDWDRPGNLLQISFRDLWLQVLIDDHRKQDWIHTEEDLGAVGLPLRSATP